MNGDTADAASRLDPVTLEVIDNRIDEIVREMQHVMFRTGYSTIIRDSKDGSAGICLPDGRVIGQEFQLPLHCGVFPPTIQGIYDYYDREEIEPGDVFLVNDPYLSGANHSPDILIVTPVFFDGALQAFCCTIAHKPDIGGLVPGTSSPDARELYHEGIQFPPVKYWRAGEVDQDIENIVRNNSRTPEVTLGDIRGQTGCTQVGVEKMQELFEDYGTETITTAAETLLESTRTRVQSEIVEWDGEVEITGQLDSVPGDEDLLTISLRLRTNAGEGTLTFDFSDSDPQSEAPVNMQPHVVKSACMLGLVGIVDSTLPLNAGIADACEFVLPSGTVVNPNRPAPCNTYSKGMCVVVQTCLRALSSFAPEKAVAETGNTGSVTIGNLPNASADSKTAEETDDIVLYDFSGGGFGGHSTGDGASCMASTYKSNVQFPPVEILEAEFPHRLTQFSIAPDSAGAGQFRGGMGFVREYTVTTPSRITYRGANHRVASRGVEGGMSSGSSRTTLNPDEPDSIELDPIDTVDASPGDVLRVYRAGGAGYGDPRDRDSERVLADIRDGFVSIETAAEEYGVVVRRRDGDLEVDEAATRKRRKE
jgi:N-methylhydantoinase B